MNRGNSHNRGSNRNLNVNSSRAQNPQALHGVGNRHAPSAGAPRGAGRNSLTKGGNNGNGINLDNFTTSQKNINNAILEYF